MSQSKNKSQESKELLKSREQSRESILIGEILKLQKQVKVKFVRSNKEKET